MTFSKPSFKKIIIALGLVTLILLIFLLLTGGFPFVRKLVYSYLCDSKYMSACTNQYLLTRQEATIETLPYASNVKPTSRNFVLGPIVNNDVLLWSSSGPKIYKITPQTTFGLSIFYTPGSRNERLVNEMARKHSIQFTTQSTYTTNSLQNNTFITVSYFYPLDTPTFKKIAKPGVTLNAAIEGVNLMGVMVVDLNKL